jgi:hypothetical protein
VKKQVKDLTEERKSGKKSEALFGKEISLISNGKIPCAVPTKKKVFPAT